MAEATEVRVAGVTLTQYAFVSTGLADGLALDELLGFLRLDAAEWEAAEAPWEDRILDAVGEADLEFLHQHELGIAEAQTHWTRRVPPFDEELRTWLAFFQTWQREADPEDYLHRLGLSLADLAYVHRLWSERMRTDAQLRETMLALMSEDLGEPPVPAPEPPRLIRPGRTASSGANVTGDIPLGEGKTLPFAEGEARPLPPPLAVPLPRRKRPRATAPGIDETRLEGAASLAAPLPFATPDARANLPTREATRADAGPAAHVNVAEVPATAPSAPTVAPRPPEIALVPHVLEPTLILPATPQPPVTFASESSASSRPGDDLDRTTAIRITTGEVVSFADAFGEARPSARAPLTLEQHAALIAELTAEGNLSGLLMRNGLSAEEKQHEDARWAQACDRDPSVRRAWMRHFTETRERLAAAGEKS